MNSERGLPDDDWAFDELADVDWNIQDDWMFDELADVDWRIPEGWTFDAKGRQCNENCNVINNKKHKTG